MAYRRTWPSAGHAVMARRLLLVAIIAAMAVAVMLMLAQFTVSPHYDGGAVMGIKAPLLK
jgi:capsular polysaccharide biosynthesis protein